MVMRGWVLEVGHVGQCVGMVQGGGSVCEAVGGLGYVWGYGVEGLGGCGYVGGMAMCGACVGVSMWVGAVGFWWGE